MNEILQEHGLIRSVAKRYVSAVVAGNQQQTADKIEVHVTTVYKYKKAFAAMSEIERLTVISELAQERLNEVVDRDVESEYSEREMK